MAWCGVQVSAVQHLTEFVDGEPLKFTITTADHKLYLKTSSIHVKQVTGLLAPSAERIVTIIVRINSSNITT